MTEAPARPADSRTARGLLVVDLATGFGGAERRALEQAAELHRRGEQVRLVAHEGTLLIAAARERGVPVIAICGSKYRPSALRHLRAVLHEHRDWAVETHNSWSRACALVGAPSSGLTTVHSAPAQSEGRLAARVWHQPLLRMSAARGWTVVAVSSSVADHLVRDLGLPAGQVRTVWNGVPGARPPAPVPSLRTELGIDPDALVVTTAGRLIALKQVPAIVDAFSAVMHQVPTAHLLVVGEGPEMTQVVAAISRCNPSLRDHLHLLGRREDMPRVLDESDLVVLASLTEGLPMVVLEAAQHRVPVLSTDVGSIREALGADGVILLPAGVQSTDSLVPVLATNITALLCDPTRRAKVAEVAHRRVQERFTVEAMTTEMAHLGGLSTTLTERQS